MAEGKLKQVLGRWEVLALSFGAMIGWGWVILAGGWIDSGGLLGAALAFAVGGLAIFFIGLTYAELAAALPFAGGEHVYTHRAFGAGAALICTWSIVLGYVSVAAFEAVALPTAVGYLYPNLEHGYLWEIAGDQVYALWAAIGMLASVLVTAINIHGLRLAARVQLVAVTLIVVAGIALVAGALLYDGGAVSARPLWNGLPGMFGVLIMVPFMFVGFDVIPQSAEEIGTSQREIGKLLMISVTVAIAFYILIIFAIGRAPSAVSPGGLAAADAAGTFWQTETAANFIVLAGIGGILTSWNAFLIGASRALYALARAGQAPRWLGVLHRRHHTPVGALLFVGGLATLAPLLGHKALVWFVDAGGFGIVVAYTFVAAAFLKLRISEPEMARPYRVPAGLFCGIIALILALALGSLYLPGMSAGLLWPQEWALVAGWFMLGGAIYLSRGVGTGKRGRFME